MWAIRGSAATLKRNVRCCSSRSHSCADMPRRRQQQAQQTRTHLCNLCFDTKTSSCFIRVTVTLLLTPSPSTSLLSRKDQPNAHLAPPTHTVHLLRENEKSHHIPDLLKPPLTPSRRKPADATKHSSQRKGGVMRRKTKKFSPPHRGDSRFNNSPLLLPQPPKTCPPAVVVSASCITE